MTNFPMTASSICVSFTCPICGEDLSMDIDDLPRPDMSAENASDSESGEDFEIMCETCNETFRIEVYVNMYEGNVIVYDSSDNEVDANVDVTSEED